MYRPKSKQYDLFIGYHALSVAVSLHSAGLRSQSARIRDMEKKSDGDDEDEHGNVVETGILLLKCGP
jgi:hypothetical protein